MLPYTAPVIPRVLRAAAARAASARCRIVKCHLLDQVGDSDRGVEAEPQ